MAEYTGLVSASDADAPHVGGNIVEGDPFTYAPSVWNYLIHRFFVMSFEYLAIEKTKEKNICL